MPLIFHVTTKTEWEAGLQLGFYEAASLSTEGFIHCSEEHQVAGVLERYFKGKKGLVKLRIDPEKLTSPYVQEWSASTQDTFPHIYGPINPGAVVEVVDL